MKDAYVLVAHTGDRGMQQEGGIMRDLSNERFNDLVKVGLVREATADEVKNWKPPFEEEPKGDKPAGMVLVAVADLHAMRERVETLGDDLRAADESRVKLESDLIGLRDDTAALTSQLSAKDGQIKTLESERDKALAAVSSGGGSVTSETSTLNSSSDGDVAGEKAAAQPENGEAPAPSNKAAARASAKA